MAVDGQHVYWANSGNGTIGRANLDGGSPNQSFISGANSPFGVPSTGSTSTGPTAATARSAGRNLDGASANQSFITGANVPHGVAVDGQHVYWANVTSATARSGGRTSTAPARRTRASSPAPSEPSGLAVLLTVPGAPTGVSAVAGNGQATVSFTAPGSNGGAAISSYTVTASPGGATASGASSPIVVSGLDERHVVHVHGHGDERGRDGRRVERRRAAVTPATVPGAPTGVSAVAGNGQATVSFARRASNGGAAISSYTVTASPGGAHRVGAVEPDRGVRASTNGTAYTFTVTATNAVGTGPPSAPSNPVTPATVPGAADRRVGGCRGTLRRR